MSMKGKKLLTTLVVGALCASLMFAVTACNKGGGSAGLGKTDKISLADYATEYVTAETLAKKGFTKVEERKYIDQQIEGNSLFILTEGEGASLTYSVYNLSLGKTLASGLKSEPVIHEESGITYVKIGNNQTGSDQYQTKLLTADGFELLPFDRYVRQDYSDAFTVQVYEDRFVGTSVEPVKVVTAMGMAVRGSGTSATQETVIKAYTVTETDGTVTYTAVAASDVRQTPYDGKDYTVGSTLLDTEYIGNGFSYEQIGDTFRFYNRAEGTQKEITIENGESVGVIGDYMYIATSKAVAPDATSGYNFVMGEEKIQYGLQRYNYVNGSLTTVNTDFVITNILPLKNHSTEKFDAAMIGCLKMIDGVAIADESNLKVYMTDAELRVAFDATAYIDREEPSLEKLDATHFLVAGKYVVDEKGKYIMTVASGEKIYAEQGLISFTYNGLTGFKDFDGKIVIAPNYSVSSGNIVFIGDVADVMKADVQNGSRRVFLQKNGTETEAPQSDPTNNVTVKLNFVSDGAYTVTKFANEKYTVEVKNLAGTTLKTFTDLSNANDVYLVKHNGELYVNDSGATPNKLFKLA